LLPRRGRRRLPPQRHELVQERLLVKLHAARPNSL
jgi:hypothetical protein